MTIVSTRAVLVDVLLSVIIATGAAVLTVAKCYSAVGAWKRLAMVALWKFNSANNVKKLFVSIADTCGPATTATSLFVGSATPLAFVQVATMWHVMTAKDGTRKGLRIYLVMNAVMTCAMIVFQWLSMAGIDIVTCFFCNLKCESECNAEFICLHTCLSPGEKIYKARNARGGDDERSLCACGEKQAPLVTKRTAIYVYLDTPVND